MKKYLITDPKYYTTTPKQFGEALNRSLIKYTPDFVCFRDKASEDKRELLKVFESLTKGKQLKALINGSLELALEYGLDGVHLQASQQAMIEKVKNEGIIAVISCHSAMEAIDAFAKGADFVTLSPIFDTPNKGVPLGIEVFSDILAQIDKTKVFALGGIDDENKAAEIAKLGAFGFASIRYFVR